MYYIAGVVASFSIFIEMMNIVFDVDGNTNNRGQVWANIQAALHFSDIVNEELTDTSPNENNAIHSYHNVEMVLEEEHKTPQVDIFWCFLQIIFFKLQ